MSLKGANFGRHPIFCLHSVRQLQTVCYTWCIAKNKER